jgi:hypothetical protein
VGAFGRADARAAGRDRNGRTQPDSERAGRVTGTEAPVADSEPLRRLIAVGEPIRVLTGRT